MKVAKKQIRNIIQEEYKKARSEKILRESIRILLIENSGSIDEGIFGDIGSALSNLVGGTGDAVKNAAERVSGFFKDDELDMSKIPMDKLGKAKTMADALLSKMEKEPVTRKSEDKKKEEVKKDMEEVLAIFADFLKESSEALTMAPNKPNDGLNGIREFMEVIKSIDKIWTEGKRRKAAQKLSQFDWATLNPLYAKYKGPKPSEIAGGADGEAKGSEEKTSAGKAVSKLLDGTATKALKVAFSKANSKDSIKETLRAILAELPEKSQGYLSAALKELASEI